MDRHWDENTKVLVWQVQFHWSQTFFAQINLPSLQSKTKLTILPTYVLRENSIKALFLLD